MRNFRALPWLALSVLLLGSCDDDDDDEIVVYQAVLRQINPQLGLTAPLGNAEIVVEGDDIVHVKVDATGLDAVDHPMFLRVGTRCPGPTSDLNNDGYVDVNEGLPSYGSILVALDSDLDQSTTEAGSFPVGPIISYRENAEVDDFESSLSGRTIVIHGVGSAPPATVTPLVGMSTSHSVPILCGILVEIGG